MHFYFIHISIKTCRVENIVQLYCRAVLQKHWNAGTYNSRQKTYLLTTSQNLQTIWTYRGNCLQIWLLSGFIGYRIPGFLQAVVEAVQIFLTGQQYTSTLYAGKQY